MAIGPLSRPSADAEGHPLPLLRGRAVRAAPQDEGEGIFREAIVSAARGWIGTPYRHQAALKGVGCDCLGLLIGVWSEVTGRAAEKPPPYTADWAEALGRETLAEAARRHMREIAPDAARAGDVLLFRWRAHLPAKHCGILVGPERMVHAQEGAVVTEVPLNGWWQRRAAFGFGFSLNS